jgi:GT2 family glycosyltransferase
MRLSVIIVNYNVCYFLEQCLFSVQKALRGIDGEILVVDNASGDGSKNYIEPKFPTVRFFWLGENLGFAKANNFALSKANGEYILFLNPDTIVPEDVFHLCIAYLDSNKNVGALGIRMLDGSGNFLKESKRAFPSPITAFFKLTGLANVFPGSPVFAKYHLGHLDEKTTQEADVLSGAFMMSRKTILDKCLGFDESFFMYGEDIDLSYRIKKSGYINVYFADSAIIHFKGESTKKDSFKYVKMFYSAMAIFVRKHYGGASAGVFLFFIQLAIWFRALLTVIYNFIKPIRLTVSDGLLIAASFVIAITTLDELSSASVGYPPLFSFRSPMFYALAWFCVSRFTKLYEFPFRNRSLYKNLFITTAISLVAASWLADELYLSHIYVLTAAGIFIILASFYRWILRRLGFLPKRFEMKVGKILVAGSSESFNIIEQWFTTKGKQSALVGRVAVDGQLADSVCRLDQVNEYVAGKNIDTIIFCENGFSFSQIIRAIDQLKTKLSIRIAAAGSASIVGSDSKDDSGETFSI